MTCVHATCDEFPSCRYPCCTGLVSGDEALELIKNGIKRGLTAHVLNPLLFNSTRSISMVYRFHLAASRFLPVRMQNAAYLKLNKPRTAPKHSGWRGMYLSHPPVKKITFWVQTESGHFREPVPFRSARYVVVEDDKGITIGKVMDEVRAAGRGIDVSIAGITIDGGFFVTEEEAKAFETA